MAELKSRIEHVRKLLTEKEIDTLLVMVDANRRYLSGFTPDDHQIDESSGALLITAERLVLATDSRFDTQARQEAPLYEVVIYREGLAKDLPGLTRELNTVKLGFESARVSYSLYANFKEKLTEAGSKVTLAPIEDLVEQLRLVKSADEIDRTARSLALAEQTFLEVVRTLSPGMTENEVAWAMEKGMREAGAEALAFPVIVAAGPNSALPHAVPGNRPIKEGEPLLFDWGARLNGYCSDISRTIILGEPDETFLKVHQTVLEAQQRAIKGIKAGANTKAIDALARTHIDQQGFTDKFSHSLGHGTGLVVHEGPRLGPVKERTLESGMIVTVEPGIYLPGWGGVRIENQVVVEENGARVLNGLSTSFRVDELLKSEKP